MKMTFIAAIFLATASGFAQGAKNGEIWPDADGVHINAHGGGFLHDGGTWYWYGEHKIEGKAGAVRKSCAPDDSSLTRRGAKWYNMRQTEQIP